ncbi:MAG: hypothetical protein IKP77_06660 [Acholeplasmatales bacterium]|nr:hypothetical protein [Acholeplasmatales bacterium]
MGDFFRYTTNNFDYRIILSFIVGLALGMVLICLIYALLIVLSLRDKKYVVKVNPENLKEEEAMNMIHLAQESFKDKNLRGKMSKAQYFRRLTSDLVYGIASSFYPDSKYPLLEITLDEAIDLIGYIQERLDDIFDKKLIKLLKKFKISDIVAMSLNTQSVMESKAFKVTKNISEKASKVKKVIDIINPVNWFRRLVVDNAIKIVTNKLFLVTLGIIGEEAYKIYSKSVLNVEASIDSNVDEIVDSINDDIREIANQDKEEEKIKFMSRAYKANKKELAYSSAYDLNYKFMERVIVEVNDEEEQKEE